MRACEHHNSQSRGLRGRVPALRSRAVVALGVGGAAIEIARKALKLAGSVLVAVAQVHSHTRAVRERDVELEILRVGEMQGIDDLGTESEPPGRGVRRREVDGAGGHDARRAKRVERGL